MNKQPQVTEATRNRIADAFFELYKNRPMNKIYVSDIAKAAHCNRSTFYVYFKDIFDVRDYIEQKMVDDVIALSSSVDAAGPHLLSEVAALYKKNGEALSVLLGENGDPQFAFKFKRALYDTFLSKEAAAPTPEMKVIYEFGINGLLMACMEWYTHQDALPVENFLMIMKKVMTTGILPTIESLK